MYREEYLVAAIVFAAIAVIVTLTLAPWLLGRWQRKQGEHPHYLWRAGGCFLMGTALLQIISIASMLAILIAGPVEGPINLGSVALGLLSVLVLVVLWWPFWVKLHIVKLPTLSRLTLVILLCNACYLAAFGTFNVYGLGRLQEVTTEIDSGNNLHIIGKELNQYKQEHGRYPDDLRQLINDRHLDYKCFVSPFAVRRGLHGPIPYAWPYTGPCDYAYNRLLPDAPSGLVWAWEDPAYRKVDRVEVLYTEGRVAPMSKEELQRELARTREWMKAHPAPTTGSAPAPAELGVVSP